MGTLIIILERQVMRVRYKSTRDSSLRLEASQVIARGISEEGGLFVPDSLPDLSPELPALAKMDYKALAKRIFSFFLTDFSQEEVAACVGSAYTAEKFGNDEPVKLTPLTANGERKYLLELWHGPTCAFKDMALQILPHFLVKALEKSAPGKEAVILTATSGDTGKAALEGFKDVPGTRILVFYPRDGVSPMQKLQMTTQEGGNVFVCAIEGNFDDAQTAVKRIFTDEAMKTSLENRGMLFSSANSINWGRLLPQIVYYFYAYFRLCGTGALRSLGDKINIAVPTGNFGNILAAYYAKRMSLPVNKLICASNQNRVLADFIHTGEYDRRREFFATASPSMDILVSSNLERLLYALSGEDDGLLAQWMRELSETGVYRVTPQVAAEIKGSFYGGSCDDTGAFRAIRETLEREGYLCDTHTAVAVDVYRQYVKETGDSVTPTVIASTASPYKFTKSVLLALGAEVPEDEFQAVSKLERLSHTSASAQLRALKDKPIRFRETVEKARTADFVRKMTGIGGI